VAENGMKIYTKDGDILATFYSVKREGGNLVIDGKVLDTMRMDMVFSGSDFFKAARIIFSWPVISFLLLFPLYFLKCRGFGLANKRR
jgi:hypothetical protein